MTTVVPQRAVRLARQGLVRLPQPAQSLLRRLWRRVRPVSATGSRKPPALVSIVVPVYNVERYLVPCLDSLLAQTYRRLQIILVDDGSPDRSIDIMTAYAGRDPRIEILRQANAGLGAARNAGAGRATGKYLLFVDSDDVLPPDAIRYYVRTLRKSGSDFAVGLYQRISSAGTWAAAWWVREAHRVTLLGTNLQEFPQIQVNAVAWSKFYRRRFWVDNEFAFPEGVLYEDQAVSSRVYVTARAFDVLSRVTYAWRVRDDRTSITQQNSQVSDLRARLHAAYESLAALDGPGFEQAREVRLAHYLGNDFPLSIKAAQHADDEFWELLRGGLQRLTTGISDEVWKRVSAQHRVAIQLTLADRRAEVADFTSLGHNNPKNVPVLVQDGQVYLEVAPREVLGMSPTDPLLALAEHQMGVLSSIRRAYWADGGVFRVEGWAYIDNVDLAQVETRVEAWFAEVGGEGRVDLTVTPCRTKEVTAATRHRYADYESSGFTLEIEPGELLASATTDDGGDWQLHLRVTSGGIERCSIVRSLEQSSSAGRLHTELAAEQWQVTPLFNLARGLVLRLRRPACIASDVVLDDRTLTLSVQGVGSFVPIQLELVGTQARRVLRTPLTAGEDNAATGRVVVPDLLPTQNSRHSFERWLVRVVSLDGQRSPAALLDYDRSVTTTMNPHPHLTRRGNLGVIDEPRRVQVDRAHVTEAGELVLGGSVFGSSAAYLTFTVANPRATASAAAVDLTGGRFSAVVPLRYDAWGLGETPLPVGGYTLRCTDRGDVERGDGARPVVVHVEQGVTDQFPSFFAGSEVRGRLSLVRPDGLQVNLEVPLADSERGARMQERLQLALRSRVADPSYERGAVLFRSYYGEIAGCNTLAVHRELRRRGTGHRLYWAVKDHSVQVPEGGIAVVHDSAEFYRLLHDAEFYMDNMHQPIYHRKPAHQVQVQTFHGYPFKQMGISHWHWQERDVAHIQSYLDRAKDWDYLVSPARYGTKYLCAEFGFDNKVLEIGYPRNDVLLRPEAPRIAAEVRARLGIRPDQTVVLYGPTFRDEMSQNDFQASMVDFLDIPRLASELGDRYVVLVRGHAFNARVNKRIGSRGNVIDVTDYPDIADLCLASDVAVLDYSSLRFDYGLTDKPMIFMVPDLERYQDTSRGSLFDYQPTAPGPLVGSTAEVIDAVLDLDGVRREYAAAYAEFKAHFLDLDDGHAAERLVDAAFRPDEY